MARTPTPTDCREGVSAHALCPRCERRVLGRFPALSRVDDATPICSPCGTDEALHDLIGSPLGSRAWVISDWPVPKVYDLSPMAQA